jgi:HEAT repeat protein
VIIALSKIATTSSIEFLIQALNSRNPEIRSCAALALGETGSKMAQMPLKNLLTDRVQAVRKSAAKALGLIEYLPIK